jgi:hypothetical protein
MGEAQQSGLLHLADIAGWAIGVSHRQQIWAWAALGRGPSQHVPRNDKHTCTAGMVSVQSHSQQNRLAQESL